VHPSSSQGPAGKYFAGSNIKLSNNKNKTFGNALYIYIYILLITVARMSRWPKMATTYLTKTLRDQTIIVRPTVRNIKYTIVGYYLPCRTTTEVVNETKRVRACTTNFALVALLNLFHYYYYY